MKCLKFKIQNSDRFGSWILKFPLSYKLGRSDFTMGFTLMEVVVTTGILGLIMLAVGMFQANIFGYHLSLSNQLTSQHESRRAIEQIVAELRASSYAGNGGYPIETASATSLVFYTNADRDGGIERVRYYLNGSNLQRGIIEPSGTNPVLYTGTEASTIMVKNIVNGSTALFTYYDDSYAGSGIPLSPPVNVNEVRYVHIILMIDTDPNRPPLPLRVEGGASIRNLKENL
jgi:type II secretory pathway component PulJ